VVERRAPAFADGATDCLAGEAVTGIDDHGRVKRFAAGVDEDAQLHDRLIDALRLGRKRTLPGRVAGHARGPREIAS